MQRKPKRWDAHQTRLFWKRRTPSISRLERLSVSSTRVRRSQMLASTWLTRWWECVGSMGVLESTIQSCSITSLSRLIRRETSTWTFLFTRLMLRTLKPEIFPISLQSMLALVKYCTIGCSLRIKNGTLITHNAKWWVQIIKAIELNQHQVPSRIWMIGRVSGAKASSTRTG